MTTKTSESQPAQVAMATSEPGDDASVGSGSRQLQRQHRRGANSCTSVLDGGAPPNGCLDNGGCDDFMYNLTPNVFAEAATCVGQIPSCSAGNPEIMTCLTTALSGACLDPSTASYCAQIDAAEASCSKGSPRMPVPWRNASSFCPASRRPVASPS